MRCILNLAIVLFFAAGLHAASPACNGIADDTAAFNNAPAGTTFAIPSGATCRISNLTLASNTHIKCGAGAKLQRIGGAAAYMGHPMGVNQSIENCVIDLGGIKQATPTGYQWFVESATNFQMLGNSWINSGAIDNTMGALLVFNSSATISSNTMTDGKITGTQIKVDGAPGKAVRITNNTLYGSAANAIQATNSANYVPRARKLDVQVMSNTIKHVTDGFGGSGETGNAIDFWQCDGCIADSNDLDDIRFSCVRIALSADVKAGLNKCNHARESSFYCELGSINCVVRDNLISNYIDGINLTNTAQRVPDETNLAEGNTLTNGTHYGIKVEHDIARGNKIDGVPFCILMGFGGSSHDNVVDNNSCTQSSPAYTPVLAAVGVDTSMTIGSNRVSGLSFSGTKVAPGVFPVAIPNTMMITGISNAASAVVSYNAGEQPQLKDAICFMSIVGMAVNGQCGVVLASGPTTVSIALDTRALGAFVNPTGSQRSYATILYRGTVPRYSLPANLAYTLMSPVAAPTNLNSTLN